MGMATARNSHCSIWLNHSASELYKQIKLDQVGSSWKFGRLGSLQMPQLCAFCKAKDAEVENINFDGEPAEGCQHREATDARETVQLFSIEDIEASNLCRRFGSDMIYIDSLYDAVM